MTLFAETIEREFPDLDRQGVRVRFVGRRDRCPQSLRDLMEDMGPGDDALARYVERMATIEQVTPLGEIVSYNNASLSVAGRVIEKVTGKTYMQDRAGWVKPVGKGWLVYLMPGHRKSDFENPAYGRIVLNAKTQRPSVCNAAEKLLVHASVASVFIPRIVRELKGAGVELRGDQSTIRLVPGVSPATEEDWSEEYLRLCMAIRVVPGVEEAIEHINCYSTKHSEAIVTANEDHARKFLRLVDSAAVYWNASTRFTDGGEFGFGAEMGVSTQKLHCRGPFALRELTSTKYEIIGSGQVRG